uniref:Uncharacterized protein n=1 Tax=Denticeps clupeoides TaxID=299321 RepID=A0AAY4BJS7_9TELE
MPRNKSKATARDEGVAGREAEPPSAIPAGRQLDRTPPPRHTSAKAARTSQECEFPLKDKIKSERLSLLSPYLDCAERRSVRRSSATSATAKMWEADNDTFVQGMEGYEWTAADLEFVNLVRKKTQLQQIQKQLAELEQTLKAEGLKRDKSVATRESTRGELLKMPSSDQLLQLSRDVLSRHHNSSELENLDPKSLLGRTKLEDVRRAITEEAAHVAELDGKVANAQKLRDQEELSLKELEKRVLVVKVILFSSAWFHGTSEQINKWFILQILS